MPNLDQTPRKMLKPVTSYYKMDMIPALSPAGRGRDWHAGTHSILTCLSLTVGCFQEPPGSCVPCAMTLSLNVLAVLVYIQFTLNGDLMSGSFPLSSMPCGKCSEKSDQILLVTPGRQSEQSSSL